MMIWKYAFDDKTRYELLKPLTGEEFIEQTHIHGAVVVDFEVIKLECKRNIILTEY